MRRVILLGLLAFTIAANAIDYTLDTTLYAGNPQTNANFGIRLDVDGDTLVVGASHETISGAAGRGAAYVYVKAEDSWSQQAKLLASDGAALDFFGIDVGINGDTIIVGANGDNSGRGGAYIFTRSNGVWTQTQKLTASDGAAGDSFGQRVRVFGSYAIVGAFLDDSGKGSAYVYENNGGTWTQVQKLTASDGANGDEFGVFVEVYGNTALVGARRDDDKGADSGSAYVFTRQQSGTWVQSAKLTASDGGAGDWFGSRLFFREEVAVIMAPFYDVPGKNDVGAAYVFARSGATWSQRTILTASDAVAGDQLGDAGGFTGTVIVAGAPHHPVNGLTDAGAAYVWARSGDDWKLVQKLAAPSPGMGDTFGVSGDQDDLVLAIGAFKANAPGVTDAGAVFTYNVPPGIGGDLEGGEGTLFGPDGALFGGDKEALAEALKISTSSLDILMALLLILVSTITGYAVVKTAGAIGGAALGFAGSLAFGLIPIWVLLFAIGVGAALFFLAGGRQ